ncbi:hypothetical protein ACQ86E_19695 [Bradyrhizobium betae]|uniref:hypothetical protein n=1 Tax=Bradyrhizobium betae TaxID=244734 RepID=UPI003D6651CD
MLICTLCMSRRDPVKFVLACTSRNSFGTGASVTAPPTLPSNVVVKVSSSVNVSGRHPAADLKWRDVVA